MKNNKKGFTLIELLAVIAILAILVVLAVPAILKIFNDSKASAFRDQAQILYKAAETQYVSKQLEGTTITKFTNISGVTGTGVAALDLGSTTAGLKYCIILTDGKVTKIGVSDNNYSIATYSISSISDLSTKAFDATRTDLDACS